MATARIVFTLLWMVTVLPLVFFNLEKFYIRNEGEKPKPNIPVIASIAVLAIVITIILAKTYNFTIDYQPVLVADRFINTMSTDEYEEAQQDYSKLLLVSPEDIEGEINELFQAVPARGGRYQLGTIIRAKYFYDKEFFPSENVEKDQADVVCVMVRIDNGQGPYDYFIIRMRKIQEYKWRIDRVMKASEEAVAYGQKYDLIPKEHGGTWLKF